MSEATLHPTACALCKTEGNASELYPPNFDLGAFNPEVFSARRLPDRIHYRLVRCNACGLVRSDPVADPQTLAQLYAQSSFDYSSELGALRQTYGKYLARLQRLGAKKGSLLEIGCGNGFFLEEALAQGYRSVRGVEPSADAVSRASPAVREFIVCDIARPGLFEPEQFDVICIFQVFDHIADPNTLLEECFRILKHGGLLLIFNHNIEAFSARLLGERSPIIDIEHTYLYSPATLSRLARSHGFEIAHAGPVFNTYSLAYLTRLLPFPAGLKRRVLAALNATPLARIQLPAPLGNAQVVARKSNG